MLNTEMKVVYNQFPSKPLEIRAYKQVDRALDHLEEATKGNLREEMEIIVTQDVLPSLKNLWTVASSEIILHMMHYSFNSSGVRIRIFV